MNSRPLAVVFYGYSKKNAGDMAITLGAIDLLMSRGFQVHLVSRYDSSSAQFKDSSEYIRKYYGNNVKISGCPFRLDRNCSAFEQIKNYLYSFGVLVRIIRPSTLYELITKADLIVFNGGNLFRSTSMTDSIRLLALAFPLWHAAKKEKPYLIFPQSSTRLEGIGYYIVRSMLSNSQASFVREGKSHEYLQSIYPALKIQKSCDLAFLINESSLCYPNKSNTVCFTIRGTTIGDLGELDHEQKHKIKDRILKYVKKCISSGFEVKFVCQTEADKAFTEDCQAAVNKLYGHDHKIVFIDDVFELKTIYREASLLVGMRLHSIILAISEGTPCFGLFSESWGLKNPGVLSEFGLQYEYFDSDEDIIGTYESFPHDYIEGNSNLKYRSSDIVKGQSSSLIDAIDKELERIGA